MTAGLRTYDPKKVIITFGGVPITGFADGTFLKIAGAADRFTRKIGADGEVSRVRGNNDCHDVEITLLQTSPGNAYLSSVLNIDRLTNLGVRPLSVTDLSGASIMFWPEAWIKKDPDQEFSKDVMDRTWALETGQVFQETINGNLLPG